MDRAVLTITKVDSRGNRSVANARVDNELRFPSNQNISLALQNTRVVVARYAGSRCHIGRGKRGNWDQWYRTNIPLADDLFDEHLRKLKGAK